MAGVLRPVGSEERIRALDLLRGWAMFGVLWSNLNDQYGAHEPTTALDHALSWTQQWLLESRFYSLLILLFGIGFAIQLARAEGRGMDLRAIYYRRTAVLLGIGIVHGTLIWSGDILTIYALVAFALVMFRNVGPRRILIAAVVLYFVGPTIVTEAMVLSGLRIPLHSGAAITAFAHGTWLAVERARVDAYLQWLGRWGLQSYVTILASYLMGVWVVQTGYLRRVFEEPRVTRRLLALAVGASAVGYASWIWAAALWPPTKMSADVFTPPYPGFQVLMLRQFVLRFFDWATLGPAVAYACLLLLLWQRPRGQRLLGPLAATGQMALTTYLTQSVVCTFLFYGYGLGWYGRVGYTGMLLITLVLFGCQMLASTWWLHRFRYGPVEWLWRTLSYGQAPKMRVSSEEDR